MGATMRAVIYARYSSDLQRDASIEDQLRLCKAKIGSEGWMLSATYMDRAQSGASRLRPGYQCLLEDARKGQFDILVAEALDRLSRDQEDIASLYKQISFAGVKLTTIAEGEISELHVGLKGTMNALFLKDLGQKVRRGLEGRVRQGRSGGGRCYGYEVALEHDARGEPIRGGRRINETEAAIVRRIFMEFIAGNSPKAIARRLNAEKIPGPFGKVWSDTTIRGHHDRRTGILRNDLYSGLLVWNKQHYVRDPRTGKRLARPNPQSQWVVEEVPELRIIDDALWSGVQARLEAIHESPAVRAIRATEFWKHRRAQHVLTGKVFCGVCGSPAAAVGRDYLACSRARHDHACSNKQGVRRPALESIILDALRQKLMAPALVKEFANAFIKEVNQQSRDQEHEIARKRRELADVSRKLDGLVDAIASGLRGASAQQRLDDLERQKTELQHEFDSAVAPPPLLHPNLAEIYRDRVARLHEAFTDETTRTKATDVLRGLIDRVLLHPGDHGSEFELVGDIARMVEITLPKDGTAARDRAAVSDVFRRSVKVVAGTRNHRQFLLAVPV
jgi:site-specific DNA recombinase